MVFYLIMNYLYWGKSTKNRLGLSHSSAEVSWAPAALLCPGPPLHAAWAPESLGHIVTDGRGTLASV